MPAAITDERPCIHARLRRADGGNPANIRAILTSFGADYYTQFNRERKINSHVKQLSKLGVNIPDSVLKAAIARLKDP